MNLLADKMKKNLKKVEELVTQQKYDDALQQLHEILLDNEQNVETLIIRSQIYHKLQQWGNELNDLNKVLSIDPQNEVAINYKTIVMNILSFWNKDSYNP